MKEMDMTHKCELLWICTTFFYLQTQTLYSYLCLSPQISYDVTYQWNMRQKVLAPVRCTTELNSGLLRASSLSTALHLNSTMQHIQPEKHGRETMWKSRWVGLGVNQTCVLCWLFKNVHEESLGCPWYVCADPDVALSFNLIRKLERKITTI